MSTAPTLETARLTLRAHRTEDLDACADLWGDPVTVRFIGGRPFTREECWHRLLRHVGHWTLLGFGYWMVHERDSGLFVGEVGFADLQRDLQPSLAGAPEMGWVLSPRAHGKGFATEAVRALVAWGEAHFASPRTVCIIDPGNAPSIRVAEKAGFAEIARTTYKGEPTIVFERLRA